MKNGKSFKDISLILILIFIALVFNLAGHMTDLDVKYLLIADGVSVFLVVICLIRYFLKNKERADYVQFLEDKNVTAANEVLNSFPLSMTVLDVNGEILWFNDEFQRMTNHNNLYFTKITDIFPEIKWMEILKAGQCINFELEYESRFYNVFGKIAVNKSEGKSDDVYSVILYFEDITELTETKKMYKDERTDVVIVSIDNYDELFRRMDDSESQELVSKINSLIIHWGLDSRAVTKRVENDRYIMFFEHEALLKSEKEKFSVVEKVRKIGEEIKVPVTISIGVGTGGHLIENENNAKAAMEMVLGRGGDQAAVKDGDQYTFYGGKAKDYEKSTRVKTRSFAVALKDYILNADNVIFVGHKNADYDSLGAALGLQRAVRTLGKKPYIVSDGSRAVKELEYEIRTNIEYTGMLISPDSVLDYVTEDSVVVILDTHRAAMLPCPELPERAKKVIVIDHHRRSTDFITPVSLTYHEPYASSTCEMVTEILQHIGDVRKISPLESRALYMGIIMDTKNFVLKTGIRTFEAASYLKRCGLDTVEIKKLFSIEHDEYMRRIDAIRNAEIYEESFAIAVCEDIYNNIRVVASQAADEMMNISGVRAAFVLYTAGSTVCISARSLGDVNVQVIMEKLGGGGHATIAGAQLTTVNREEVIKELKKAINEYNSESN